MMETSHRPRLIPRSTIIAGIVIVALIAVALGGAYFVARSRLVPVTDVTGLPEDTAITLLEERGLVARQDGTQVSVSVPVGAVISQDPGPDVLVEPGSTVTYIVSAGPQSFVVPDLVGSPLEGARDVLIALGFDVVVETVQSEETTVAVVLEMYPAPGASASVGDRIRLVVPGEPTPGDVLLPYDLSGLAVLLDPQPAPPGLAADASLEVARRLRALLEAAGATVTSTRADSGAPVGIEARETSATASTAALLIGIDVGSRAIPGVRVQYTDGGDRGISSLRYARAITRAAALPGLVVGEPTVAEERVLSAFKGTGVRVVVGDAEAQADRARFADPAWADQVARAIYRGVGRTANAD